MHARNLGWLPTDCTAELRPTINVHFYASIQKETPSTHWFYFVNINFFFFFLEEPTGSNMYFIHFTFYLFSFFCNSGWKRTLICCWPLSIIVLLSKRHACSVSGKKTRALNTILPPQI